MHALVWSAVRDGGHGHLWGAHSGTPVLQYYDDNCRLSLSWLDPTRFGTCLFVMLFLFPFAYSQCLARLDPSDAEGDFSSSDEVVDAYLLCLPPRSDG